MRTTLTLEPQIAERLQSEAALGKQSFKQIVNQALRRGLGFEELRSAEIFRVIPHSSAFLPGIDQGKLNQLIDEMDASEFLNKH